MCKPTINKLIILFYTLYDITVAMRENEEAEEKGETYKIEEQNGSHLTTNFIYFLSLVAV